MIPREAGQVFYVIPAACSSDSGQAVGAKRRGWLMGTLLWFRFNTFKERATEKTKRKKQGEAVWLQPLTLFFPRI